MRMLLTAAALLTLAVPAFAQNKTVGVAPTQPSFSVRHDEIIWQLLGGLGNKPAPPEYYGSVGNIVPDSIKLRPVPPKVTEKVPPARGMLFAKVVDEVLIVNPGDRKIVEVVSEQ
jgi:hypothetical protein